MKELYCRATMTLVEQNKMRPGYDCRCSGCMAWVATHGDPMKKATTPSYGTPFGYGYAG